MNEIYTLLLADDNDDMRMVMGHQLQTRGYRVVMAADGNQAIEKALLEKPDLILLDVLMPNLDGTEASIRLRSEAVTRDIPIIFLTSLIEGSDASISGEAKDSWVMAKSTPMEVLAAKIQEILREKKS